MGAGCQAVPSITLWPQPAWRWGGEGMCSSPWNGPAIFGWALSLPGCCPLFFLPFLPSPPRGRAVITGLLCLWWLGKQPCWQGGWALSPPLAPPSSPRIAVLMGLTASFLLPPPPTLRSGCRWEETLLYAPGVDRYCMGGGLTVKGRSLVPYGPPYSCRRPSPPLPLPKIWACSQCERSQQQVQEPQGC